MSTPHRPISILSLDGGGVRGLSSLLVLRALMERLGVKRGIMPHASIRPCDCFDLIIGTGTGGISALFLGRMRMTVNEAIDEYIRISEIAFDSTALGKFPIRIRKMSRLDGRALERAVGDAVEKILGDRDAKLADPLTDPTPCRTAVLAVTSANADAPPHVFRSYSTHQPSSQFSIVDVARATVATAKLFKPVSLGRPPMNFIDAGISGYNNPVEIGLAEAVKIWPGKIVDCVVSLGTGLQQIAHVGKEQDQVVKACMSIIQSCELVHDRVVYSRRQAKLPYFRFNVDRGLGNMMEWKGQKISDQAMDLTDATDSYLRWDEVNDRLNFCISVLNGDTLALTHSEPTNVQHGHNSQKFMPLHHPAPEILHGREDYIEQAITMLLAQIGVRLAILGLGGIGKTSIVCTILHEARIESRFKEHRVFVSCEAITSIVVLVETLCSAFGIQAQHSSGRQNDLLMFLKHTYDDQPILLVLDNFETVWEPAPSDVEALLVSLGQVAGISLLLTMRGAERPAGLHWTKPLLPIVGPLSPKAAYDTFMDICAQEDEKLEELLKALDYIPLAVTLMAHLAQTEQPSHLLKRWKKEHTKLLSKKHDQGRLRNVDASICVSLESHRMKSCRQALILLSVIAQLPNGVIDSDLTAMTPTMQDQGSAVAMLCQVGLAFYDSVHTLCVLSPIRAYIMDNYPLGQKLLDDLEIFHFHRATTAYEISFETGHDDLRKTLELSEGNMGVIIMGSLQRNSDSEAHLKRSVQAALDWSYFITGFQQREVLLQLAVKTVEERRINHKKHQLLARMLHILKKEHRPPVAEELEYLYTQCLQRLGDTKYIQGNYQKTQAILSTAQAKFEAIGDQHGAAQCLGSLGDIKHMLGKSYPAQEMLSKAQAKFEAIGDHHGAAQCIQSLGDIQHMLGNYQQAYDMLSTAQAKFEVNGDQLGAAQCLRSLGSIQHMLGYYKQAQDMVSTAQAKFEAIGHQLGAAQCSKSLGDIQHMLGNYPQAQKMVSTTQTKFEAIGDQLGAAQCLKTLGDIQRIFGNYQQSQEMVSTAQTKFEAIGDQLGTAQCLQSLGNIEFMFGNCQQAQDMLSTAQAKFEAIGNQCGAAQSLRTQGEILFMLGNWQQAQNLVSIAQAKFEAIGNQCGTAQCLRSLGDIQFMLGNWQQAQDMVTTAQAKFETIGNQCGGAQCLQSLGNIQFIYDNCQQAQDIMSTAQAKFEAIGNQHGATQCLKTLGDIQCILGNYQQSQDMLSTAQAKFKAIGNQVGLAQCLWSLGKTTHMLGYHQQAQNMVSTAQAMFEAMEHQLGVAQCLQSLGDIQCILGNYQQSQDKVSTAHAKFEAIGNQLGVAQCLHTLGKIKHTLGNYQEALDMVSTANTKFEAVGDQCGAAQCLKSLEDIQCMLGNC